MCQVGTEMFHTDRRTERGDETDSRFCDFFFENASKLPANPLKLISIGSYVMNQNVQCRLMRFVASKYRTAFVRLCFFFWYLFLYRFGFTVLTKLIIIRRQCGDTKTKYAGIGETAVRYIYYHGNRVEIVRFTSTSPVINSNVTGISCAEESVYD